MREAADGWERAHPARYLEGGVRPAAPLGTNDAVARFLVLASLEDLGGTPIVGPSPEGDAWLSRRMADEAIAAAGRTDAPNAGGWYTASLRRAFGAASLLHPELLDDEAARAHSAAGLRSAADARTVLTAALAITSQNIAVEENARYALGQYRTFLATGRFEPRPYGAKGPAIRANLERFNLLLDVAGGDLWRVRRFLLARFTVGELREAAEPLGIKLGTRELESAPANGSSVFGPKIGAFMANLLGDPRPVTVDMWFMRTWGRLTGTLMRDALLPAQAARLSASLKVGRSMRDGMARAGIVFDRRRVASMDARELLPLCRELHLFWERSRKALAAAGWDNAKLSEHKAAMGWPGAAEAIVKAVGATVDKPPNGATRAWIRSVVAGALEVAAGRGHPMTAADMQALLWYPEKELYDVLAGRTIGALNASYDEVFSAAARREGADERSIEDACRRGDRILGGGLGRGRGDDVGHRRGAAGGEEGVPRLASQYLGSEEFTRGGMTFGAAA